MTADVAAGERALARTLARLERRFSARGYEGSGRAPYKIEPGRVPVMLSAPHAVNQVREGRAKPGEYLTGAIACHVARVTGAHVIYAARSCGRDPNFDALDDNPYQRSLVDYVRGHGIRVLIDLHGCAATRPFAAEIGTAPDAGPVGTGGSSWPVADASPVPADSPDESMGAVSPEDAASAADATPGTAGASAADGDPSLHGHGFVARLVRYALEYELSGVDGVPRHVWKNRLFAAGAQPTVTRTVSRATDTACLQLEVNRALRSLDRPDALAALVRALETVVRVLSTVEWDAAEHEAFRLCQASAHRPQDVVKAAATAPFVDRSLLFAHGELEVGENVRLHRIDRAAAQACLDAHGIQVGEAGEYAFLTNRIIDSLFGRSWLVRDDPRHASLAAAPLVLSTPAARDLPIGMPSADKLGRVSLSTALYQRLAAQAGAYDYYVYTPYADSMLALDMERADYGDNGRVAAEKVMVPRYYKQLLGLLDLPLRLVRAEEVDLMAARLEDERDRERLRRCYEPFGDGTFVRLREVGAEAPQATAPAPGAVPAVGGAAAVASGAASATAPTAAPAPTSDDLDRVARLQRSLGVGTRVRVVRIPRPHARPGDAARAWVRSRTDALLERVVGSASFPLRATWCDLGDESNNLCRVSPYTMTLMGIEDYGKVRLTYGRASLSLRVLAKEGFSDFQIGVPASARNALDMNSVNDCVVVSRDMAYILASHSEEQVVAILGTVLAVFQVISDVYVGLALSVVCAPLIIYFSLNGERAKVK